MLLALTPAAAAERAAALAPVGGLDVVLPPHVDALVRLAARSCDTPFAALALAGEDELRLVVEHGPGLGAVALADSFCVRTLEQGGGLLEVPDTARDVRFRSSPLARGAEALRFYAGRVLRDPEGVPVGTLCVLDPAPREGLSELQREALETLADAVEGELARAPRRPAPDPVPAGALRRALQRDELELQLQPLWCLGGARGSQRLAGLEAQVHWRCPERGLLPTGALLAGAVGEGLQGRLGDAVLHLVLTRLAAWQRDRRLPPGFRLHVDVPSALLHEGGLPWVLERAAARTGACLSSLTLEVADASLLDGSVLPLSEARALTDLGVRLWLDGFGDGGSSLVHLRRYPVAGVKLGRTVVRGLGRYRDDEAVLSSVVHLARELDLDVACDGVDTPEQLEHCLRTGATAAQGTLLGRSAPAGDVEARLLPLPEAAAAAS